MRKELVFMRIYIFLISFILFLNSCNDSQKIVPYLMPKEEFLFNLSQGDILNGINFLFIVDDSGSMANEKIKLATNITKVLEPVFKSYPNYNYNFFLTSMGVQGGPLLLNRDWVTNRCFTNENLPSDLITKNKFGDYISYRGQISKQELSCAVSENIQSSRSGGLEYFFHPIESIIKIAQQNPIFKSSLFDKDKFLILFFISDAGGGKYKRQVDLLQADIIQQQAIGDEMSNQLISKLNTLRQSFKNIRSYAVIPPLKKPTSYCSLDDSVKAAYNMAYLAPHHVYSLIKKTEGRGISICDNNWGNKLTDISENLLLALSKHRLYLEKIPQLGTIEVLFNNRKVEPDINTGWYLDKESLSINFGPDFDFSYYRFNYDSYKKDKVIIKYHPLNLEILQNSK